MFVIGLAGYVMRVYDFPIAPVLIGLILGPMAETQLRRALAIGNGDPMALVADPLSIVFLGLAAIVLLLPLLLRRIKAAAG
jgi:putative tricarboxylic transport membrane protein